MWQQWLNLFVGLWIALSAYLNLAPEQAVANFTISGLIVAGLAVWGAMAHKSMERDERRQIHA